MQSDHGEVIQVIFLVVLTEPRDMQHLRFCVVTPDGCPDHLRAQGSAWVQVTIYTSCVCSFPAKMRHKESSEVNRGFVS